MGKVFSHNQNKYELLQQVIVRVRVLIDLLNMARLTSIRLKDKYYITEQIDPVTNRVFNLYGPCRSVIFYCIS